MALSGDLIPRLDGCSRRLSALLDEIDAERERRDELIVRALEEGNTYRAVARAAHLTPGTVAEIVGKACSPRTR